jgi:hypothetical protein
MFEGVRNQMVGHSISKTRGNVVETEKMMMMRGEVVRDDDSMTIDNECIRSILIPWGYMHMYFTYIVYSVFAMFCMTREGSLVQNYLEALVNAVSNRSRNLLNAVNRSAIPDFPATNGRISNNAASIPFYNYSTHS